MKDCRATGDNGGGKGNGKNAKGGGKNAKGGTPFPRRQGWGICNQFRKNGACDRMGCPWAHAKIPERLRNVAGLVLSDLGSVAYDIKTGVYTPTDEAKLDIDAIAASVQSEMAALGGVSDEYSYEEEAPQGFGGPP